MSRGFLLDTSVLTLGELHKGVLMTAESRRRDRLTQWLATTLPAWFGDRVLTIDTAVATRWAQLVAAAARAVGNLDRMTTVIAALSTSAPSAAPHAA